MVSPKRWVVGAKDIHSTAMPNVFLEIFLVQTTHLQTFRYFIWTKISLFLLENGLFLGETQKLILGTK